MLVRSDKGPGYGRLLHRRRDQLGLVVIAPATGAGTSNDMSDQRVLFLHGAVILQVVIVHCKSLYHSLVVGLLHVL